MRAALAAALAVAGLTMAPAAAHGQTGLFGLGSEGRLLSLTTVPVRTSGSLAVTWRSDPATCPGTGRCGLEGAMTWSVPRRGAVFVLEALVAGRRERHAFLLLGVEGGGGLRVQVRRATPDGSRVCTDAGPGAYGLDLAVEAGRALLGGRQLADGLLAGRCAGPLGRDVAGSLPTLRVPLSRLVQRGTRLRLDGDGAFSAGGLRGEARSTLALRIGRPRREEGFEAPRVTRGPRFRAIELRYRIIDIRGDVAVDLQGSGDPADCTLLDACGLSGTLRLVPALQRGSVFITAEAPASQGRRALRAAVGLAEGPPAPGAEVFGFGEWEGPGRVDVSIAREGDEPCVDSAPLETGGFSLRVSGGRLRATYEPLGPRTRCPGPLTSAPIATGEAPVSVLGSPRVEVPITAPATLADHAWSGTSRPGLRIVLERVSVREQVHRRSP